MDLAESKPQRGGGARSDAQAAMRDAGLDIEALGRAVHLRPSTVDRILRDGTNSPTTGIRLARAIGCDPALFCDRSARRQQDAGRAPKPGARSLKPTPRLKGRK